MSETAAPPAHAGHGAPSNGEGRSAGGERPTRAGSSAHGSGAPVAHPPLTLEGWYAQHQLFTVDRVMIRAWSPERRAAAVTSMRDTLARLAAPPDGQGWSAPAVLVGSTAELMVLHFRPTLDAVGEAQRAILAEPLAEALRPAYNFLSVTEAGMYYLASQLEKAAASRGGTVGDDEWTREAAERLTAERESPHVARRLYPALPEGMPYVCFYPMSKRRTVGQNWYEQTLEDRNRMMWAHGLSGRRYAGKVQQVVTGSIGFDAWEWGVTLFAADPLEFKRIVTEMRFDEASAKYADFGAFYVGRVESPARWVQVAASAA